MRVCLCVCIDVSVDVTKFKLHVHMLISFNFQETELFSIGHHRAASSDQSQAQPLFHCDDTNLVDTTKLLVHVYYGTSQ